MEQQPAGVHASAHYMNMSEQGGMSMRIKEHDQTCKLMQTCVPIKISFGEVGASSSATAWGGVGGVFGICEATKSRGSESQSNWQV